MMKMISLLAASGHRNDAKCSRLYFQEMLSVSDANQWLNKEFESGYHAVQHSNRFWAGLWFDRIIEQTLMRSRKCTGGLTRGRGFEENVRNLWVMSISYSAAVHESMIKLSGSWIKILTWEWKPQLWLWSLSTINWFEIRNPFYMKDGNMYSLSTGLVTLYYKYLVNVVKLKLLVLELGRVLMIQNKNSRKMKNMAYEVIQENFCLRRFFPLK